MTGQTVADSFQERVEQYLGRSGKRPEACAWCHSRATRRTVNIRLHRARRPDDGARGVSVGVRRSTAVPQRHALLAQIPVPVPDILDEADRAAAARGFGRRHPAGTSGPGQFRRAWQVVPRSGAAIAALQQRGAELASDDYLPYGVAFDEAKLGWEMEFFLKHYLLGTAGSTWTRAR